MTRAQVVVLPAGGQRLEVQSLDLPAPGPYEVAIRLAATGVCHSQLDHVDGADPTQPLLLGHEAVGAVIATGERVRHVNVGDDVLVTWLPRSGERKPEGVRIPLAGGLVAVTRNVFTWASHCLADEQYVVKAPHQLPADLVSIIGCAVMTGSGAVLNSVKMQRGDSAAIWGAGGVGLSAVAAAHNVGAYPVIAIDIAPDKLQLARRMGADHAVNALEVDAVARVRDLTRRVDGTQGVDYSFDCTGRADNLPKSTAAVRPGRPGLSTGGTNVMVGIIRTNFELPGMDLISGQKTIIGCLGGASAPSRDFPIFLDWFHTDRLDLASLVTDRYSLDQINEAVDDLRGGRIDGRAVVVL